MVRHCCYKPGCCDGGQRSVCCGRVIALMNNVCLSTLGTDLPSKTRIYTFLPHLCKQTIGIITHDVLPRCAAAAYGSNDAADVDPDSFHGFCGAKKSQSLEFLCEKGGCASTMLLTCFYVLAVDTLSLTVQKEDAKGGGLRVLIDAGPKNGIHKCIRSLWDTWAFWEPGSQSPLPAAIRHFGLEEDEQALNDFLDKSRSLAVGFGAAMHILELRYSMPILKWIGAAHLPEEARFDADNAFYNSEPCDRDAHASAPFLRGVSSVEDLRSDGVRALQLELWDRLKGGNMGLESLLSEIRASLPRGKQWSSAEGQCHLPYLNQLLKCHIGAKRPHPCAPETRKELKAQGLPVEERPDKRWTRARVVSRNDVLASSPGSLNNASAESETGNTFLSPMWPGDERLPVSEDTVKDFAYKDVLAEGLANKATLVRKEESESLIVRDDGAIPPSKRFCVDLCCLELHPGMCVSADRAIYDDTLKFARSIENCLGPSLLYQFILFKDAESDRGKVLYLARLRRRQPMAQITHVLARCQRDKDGSWQLKSGSSGSGWEFYTVWGFASTVMQQGWNRVLAYKLKWTSKLNGSVRLSNDAVTSWEVWPTICKRGKVEKDEGPNVDNKKVQKRRPTTAGCLVRGPPRPAHDPLHDGPREEIVVHLGDEDSDDLAFEEFEPPAPWQPPPEPAPPPPPVEIVAPALAGQVVLVDGAGDGDAAQAPPRPLRCPAGTHSFAWGRHKIAHIQRDSAFIGWGLTCGLGHKDEGKDKKVHCKIQCTHGTGNGALNDDEIILRLKRWALVLASCLSSLIR